MRPLRRYINEIGSLSTLHAFIMEETNDKIEVVDLKTVWNAPEKLYIEVPETYSESDIQTYMDDMLLQQMPCGDEEISKKFFGENVSNIADVYFEYDSISEAFGTNQKADIEWDSRYDSNVSSEDKLHVMCIENLKYNVLWDKFSLINVHDDDIKFELIKLFDATNSNKDNEYPFELIFDSDSLEYKEK